MYTQEFIVILIILSPAKTLDFKQAGPSDTVSSPEFGREAAVLANILRSYSAEELGNLMGISAKLAYLNYGRYQEWGLANSVPCGKQAMLSYKGDAYRGLDANAFTERELKWAQDHLRILSGLYGILRPLDLIMPYRLEFATKLQLGRYKDLYSFWNDHINRSLLDLKNTEGSHILVNLASAEYYKAIDLASTVLMSLLLSSRNSATVNTVSSVCSESGHVA